MTFKEYLISTGLTEEQATKVEQGMPEQNLYIANEENLDTRYTKLKEQKEQLESDLTTANKLVDNLKKSNKDAEDLQTKIDEYKTQMDQLKSDRAEEQKQYAIKETLTKEGVKDIDYMLYKLGEVETDKDGNIVDLDNKVKALKESNPTFFGTDDKPANEPAGYQVVDNGLDEGKPSDPEATATADFEAALGL
ncbi:scaffolding protein [Carnobacterium sp. PL17GRE32]|uniref:phage scaffolding protein n=1 Tax=Carnobacterium sp. PL17GRE32 TaxID=2592355 RepID=UPI0011F080E9|nr:phage scaffolding protein [Carnobacterium sp. PL17GRE32]KAF3306026.1 scaffolding protein [Carnobacterium sp. PL17GRE32]